MGNLTNLEVKSKDSIIHRLIDPFSKKHRTRISVDQNNGTSKSDINHGKKDIFKVSINVMKDHGEKTKHNNTGNSNDK